MADWNPHANEIFLKAMEIEKPEQRGPFVEQACGDDADLRAQVESLLKAGEKAGNFLHDPTGGENPAANFGQTMDPVRETAGTVVGRYKLLQQIGEGGMGVVYMAEQTHPVRRKVALKIIKPGMDSQQVIARFQAERQALAMMDHPNIARVLDAGCTETGRPYFVMELVQGIPITKYCDDKQLNTHERLQLFIQVCRAVQHAHQKGIIHRDIKPSNVLVMIYDSKPIPKIIDFGVAKALHQRLTEMTMFTQFGAAVGTLEYMSPEQAEMDVLGTDTRSDIYSLGVLLYELLTGSTPMDGKKLRSLGYAEMLKTIREVEPPKPSTRLSQSRQDMQNISAQRHTEPRRLQKLIAGDLDWIVMKCLEKDRTRRYETANGLAVDIERHLGDEAVSASPPGNFYKLQKLVRRNKLACTAVGCVTLALVIGLAASLWQAARAQREANRASAALNDLRAAAPSIAAEARALAAKEKFDEAIGRLDYAARLRPDVPEYLLAKADLLETQLRLADGAAMYRAALKLKPDDARAKANAELCDQLAAAPKSADGKLTRESLSRLDAQMTNDQRPAAEIMPVARLLGDEKQYIVSYWLDRLKDLPNGTDKPLDKRLTVREDGLLELDLTDMQIADLSPLAGMPLGKLDLSKCTKVTDLSPLRGMALTELALSGTGVTSLDPLHGMSSLQKLSIGKLMASDGDTKVSDLSPLSGLRLKAIEITGCPVTSLEPLRGMPLEKLNIRTTGVIDLSPLKGMPLKWLDVTGTAVTDFTPLSSMPLETLYLQGVRVGDLGFLKGVPLKQLALMGASNVRNIAVLLQIRTLEVLALPNSDLPVEDFAAIENLRNHPSIKQLAAFTPIDISLANVPSKDEFWKNWDRDYAWALRLRKAGFAFSRSRLEDGTWGLTINNKPPISDLSILSGAAISRLDLGGAKVSDLTPLKSMPLTSLALSHNTAVADLAPLRGMKLDEIWLMDTQVSDLTPLKGIPLKFLDLRKCDQLTAVAPLAEIPTIEIVLLPLRARDVESLRKLPNLKEISFSWSQNVQTCTAEQFWKTWDGLPWARKLEVAGIAFNFEQLPDGFYGVTVHDPNFRDCSIFKSSNVRQLTLAESSVADLSPLAEMPLEVLDVRQTPVTDLSPLRAPALRNALRLFVASRTAIADFSPLSDCPNLQTVDLGSTSLRDLQVFKGFKLRYLSVPGTAVSDISILAAMPLEVVLLNGTAVTDISPLLKCPSLKSITLPRDARNIEALRDLPNLTRLSYNVGAGTGNPDMAAADFWNSIKKEEPWIAALRNAKLVYKTRRLTDGSWEVLLDEQPIADLAMLKGASITRLSLMRTPVTDLSPLRGMKLTNLKLSGTKVADLVLLTGMPMESMTISGTEVRDLAPLRGMPLRSLSMTDCTQITDLSPLAGMTKLESLILPPDATNFEFLRKFPRLKRLGFRFDPTVRGPNQTAEEFWAEYDKAKSAATTQSRKPPRRLFPIDNPRVATSHDLTPDRKHRMAYPAGRRAAAEAAVFGFHPARRPRLVDRPWGSLQSEARGSPSIAPTRAAR